MLRISSAVALCLLSSACDPGPELSLQLRPGVDAQNHAFDTSALQSLHIIFDNGEKEELDVELNRDAALDLNLQKLDKTKPIGVEVWGCVNPDSCTQVDVSFRGCRPDQADLSDKTSQSEATVVTVFMFPVDDAQDLAECPAFPPR